MGGVGGAVGFVVIAVLMSSGILLRWDEAGLLEVARLRTPALTSVMQGITTIGGGDVLGPFAVLVGAWIWFRRSGRDAGHYLATVLLGWGCYGLLKWAFARPRPSVIERLDGAGWWSFPSGHAMASAIILGFAVVLVTERRLWWGAVGLLVATIAFSRVYLGVHYPSDVIAGLFGGVAWVALAAALLRGGSGAAPQAPEFGRPRAARTSDSGGGQ